MSYVFVSETHKKQQLPGKESYYHLILGLPGMLLIFKFI